ncbi:hypothetical protein ACFWN1_31860 [Streptomyces sp. NPDC058459]|uniref:hypothetical protein n=1 Tax=Streptomyces sp. NPDC058459 TaxID=3346508 RepID=UPI003664D89F
MAPPSGAGESWKRNVLLAVSALVVAVTAAAIAMAVAGASSGGPVGPSSLTAAAVSLHVFNVEGGCRSREDHVPACSMGLARDPRKKYDADNVVDHRIWHNDVLVADCVFYGGDRVADETGVGTSRWFRVRLNDVPGGYAWMPAVRTHDSPVLPRCSR